ncbi:MAG: DNA mismatch repair protein MutS [Armatimonadetes bacterium]|nr:DNA mismatch repair protein MutS [Armatimonadota bacterium]
MRPQTPMLQQYYQAKAAHPGVLMAIRVGDFYEFYGEDAETAARALEITLTGREDGSNGRIPMAGVPHHSVEKYLAKLVAQGIRVALCDQLENPKQAKGLVKRGVTRVLTAGTVVEDAMLPASANNFLAAICVQDGKAGLATLDPSTGEFLVTEIDQGEVADRLLQELARLRPAELLHTDHEDGLAESARQGLGLNATAVQPPRPGRAAETLLRHFDVANLSGFGLDDKSGAVVAAGMVLDYARHNGLTLGHVNSMAVYSVDDFIRLDPATRRSLETTQNLADGSRRNTLLSTIDCTVTAMGSRLMRRWLEQPLLDKKTILARQEAVARLVDHTITRGDLRDALKKVADIERLVSRAATGLASPRDLGALRDTLMGLPDVDDALRKVALGHLHDLRSRFHTHDDLAWTLHKALAEDLPLSARDGGVFQKGHDLELDKLRELSRDGKSYIAKLEAKERAETGLDKIKVGYNSVFGYYLELGKQFADRVPAHYIRKQTTANAERYITAELKDHESAVLGAEEKATELEEELFVRLRTKVADQAPALLQTARAIAEADVLAALAETAVTHRFTQPEIVEEDVLEYQEGRHPVVEANVPFVPNDLDLGQATRLMILTGPNMSGKSTFLRQTALLVILAQIGSFVPARSCRLGLCDRIFARIGAKDEIALGQSTFMVEMVESANILNNAGPRSLVILDEVGRGTSTYDGLAIAWAMVEHLASVGCKCLFATHYHQLNALADQVQGVANYRVSVEEVGDKVVWTHRVLPGGTDRSYGVHVARMAGVPRAVLERATEVLATLEGNKNEVPVGPSVKQVQLTLFEAEPSPILTELGGLEIDKLTPVQALMKLDEWQRKL